MLVVLVGYVVFGVTGFGASPITVPLLAHFLPLAFVLPLAAILDLASALALGLGYLACRYIATSRAGRVVQETQPERLAK